MKIEEKKIDLRKPDDAEDAEYPQDNAV